ncbi:glucose 6-phosphate 1-dehydrogenase [Helicobacter pametensis]|nr:glucose 6-phosphate 1-dehydrogenase [Helicobacter pametensis]
MLEKPLGHDLASAQSINTAVAAFFRKEQIYRIDHYLDKEPVQNLLALRFANRLFEPLWCAAQIRAVEITITEELGVEKRGEFYDQTGALRDMLQNHLLQLLCFTAMEPPPSLGDSDVRNAKLNVLRALKPFNAYSVRADVVRGQYTAGQIQGENVCGYREEANVAPQSRTETFIALRAEIDNPRWRGVPFLLRSGKLLAGRLAEIVLHFWPEATPYSAAAARPTASACACSRRNP